MNRFAALLDRLALEPSLDHKLRQLSVYFRETPDPDRGLALAAMTGGLPVAKIRADFLRALIAERVDLELFALGHDFVGDLPETIALMWPLDETRGHNRPPGPTLQDVVEALREGDRAGLAARIAGLLDELDENGRRALLKLVTGALRTGVSARLARTAVAMLGEISVGEIDEVWHGLSQPYAELFAWAEGRAPRPAIDDPAPFRSPMLAHAIEPADFNALNPADYLAEWKWDGVRALASVATLPDGRRVARLYSRAGEDMSAAFPDVIEALLTFSFKQATFDGELLIGSGEAIRPFADLQFRLGRKKPSAKALKEFPALLRVHDLLMDAGQDIRPLPLRARRARLEALMTDKRHTAFDLSPLIPFATFADLAVARESPRRDGVEGVMLKRVDSPYVIGRPRGPWWKWKRDPRVIDAVLMYARRGPGGGSLHSDFTFGVWRGKDLVPVGKAEFGPAEAVLGEIDKWIRENTRNRFGPVREVAHDGDDGLVLEITFEGLSRSARHKSGLAMRLARVARIRWDKKASEADAIGTLEALLPRRPCPD